MFTRRLHNFFTQERWGPEYRESLFGPAAMSWSDGGRVLEDKMLNAVLEQGSFVAAFTGERERQAQRWIAERGTAGADTSKDYVCTYPSSPDLGRILIGIKTMVGGRCWNQRQRASRRGIV